MGVLIVVLIMLYCSAVDALSGSNYGQIWLDIEVK